MSVNKNDVFPGSMSECELFTTRYILFTYSYFS